MIIVLCIATSLLMAALYTLIIIKTKKDELWGWLNSLFSSLISILLGVVIAILIFNVQNKITDKNKKGSFLKLISYTFQTTKINLNSKPDTINFGDFNKSVVLALLEPSPIESAVNSGLFRAEETAYLLSLETNMKLYNQKVTYFLSLIPSNIPLKQHKIFLKGAVDDIEKNRELILKTIDMLDTLIANNNRKFIMSIKSN